MLQKTKNESWEQLKANAHKMAATENDSWNNLKKQAWDNQAMHAKSNNTTVSNWERGVSALQKSVVDYYGTDGYKKPNENYSRELEKYIKQADSVGSSIYANKGLYDDVDAVLAEHDKMVSALKELQKYVSERNEYLSKFEDEDSYNKAMEDFKYTQSALVADTAQLQTELDAMLKYKEDSRALDEYLLSAEYPEEAKALDRQLRSMEAKYGVSRDTIDDQIREKESFLSDATRLQGLAALESVADPNSPNYDPEFEEKSKYIPQEYTPMSKTAVLTDNYELDGSYPWQDPLYEAINGNTQAQEWLENKAAAQVSLDNPLGRIFYRVAEGKHELLQMEDREKQLYNYYANAKDPKASEYYNLLESDLYARQRWADYNEHVAAAQKNPFGESVMSIATSPLKGLSYIGQLGDYMDDGRIDENAPYNKFSYMHSDVRGAVAQEIENGNWGKVGSWGYQLGMSMGDFLMSTAVGGGNQAAVLAIMGSGAAADMTIDAKKRGLGDDQAIALGTIAGAAEVITEKIGLDALFDTALRGKSPLIYVLKNGLSEGLEEPTSSLINLMADVIVSKDESQWRQSIQEYKDQGYDDTKAFWKAVTDQAASLGLDALGGLLSGSAMGGGSVAINSIAQRGAYRETGERIKGTEGGVEALQSISAVLGKTDAELAKLSSKISDKVANGDVRQIGRLYAAVQEAETKNSTVALTNNLIEQGYNSDVARKAAQAIVEAKNGEVTSNEQADLLRALLADKNATKAMAKTFDNENSTAYQLSQLQKKMLQGSSSAQSQASSEMNKTTGSTELATDSEEATEDGTFVKSTGQKLENVKFASVDPGNVTVSLDDGNTAKLSDVSFADMAQEIVATGISGIANISVPSANGIWQIYQQGKYSGDESNFTTSAMMTYKAGFLGDKSVLKPGDSRSAGLDAAHAKMIYDMARADAEAYYHQQQAKVDDTKKAAAEKNSTAEKKGGVFYGYEGQTIDQRKVDKDHKRLRKAQRVGIDFVKRLAKKFGTQFYFYESYEDEQGNRVYQDRNGNVVPAEKGFYDPKDGSIHIDLNGDKILFTIAHELVHQIKDWAPKQFKVMADIVMEGFSSNDVPLDVLISQQQTLAKEHGRELTEEEAFEEVIANALEGVMADGKVAQFLQQLEGRDKRLGARVRRFFNDIAQLIRDTLDAYSGVMPDSVEGIMISQLEDTYKQLQKALAEGIYQAGGNFRQAEKNSTGEGGVRYSLRVKFTNGTQVLENPLKITRSGVLNYLKMSNQRKIIDNSYFPVAAHTPKRIIATLQNAGINISDKPLAMQAKKAKQAQNNQDIHKKDGYTIRGHALSAEEVMEAIDKLGEAEAIIQETGRTKKVKKDDIIEIVPSPDAFVVFVTLDNKKECVAVIEFDSTIDPDYVEPDGLGDEYHTTITVFRPDVTRKGMPYDYFDYLNSKKSNRALEIIEESPNSKTANGENLATVSEQELSNTKVAQPEPEVKKNDSAKFGIRTSIRQKQNATVSDMLKKENEKLKGDAEKLKELLKLQRSITGGTKFTASSVEAAARVLKKSAGATGDTAELAGLLNRFYEYIATERELTWERVKEQAEAAVDWLQEHVKHRRSDYAQEILDQLHGSRIYLDDSQKQEAAHRFGSFNAFRQAVMGSITVANEGNTSLDSFWQEMSALYPDVFDWEMTAGDMPGALADVIYRLRNEDTSLLEYAYNRDMIRQDLVRQVYDTYWNVSTLRTFADVKQAQINRLKNEHLQRMQQLKAENREKVEALKESHRAEVEMIRNAYRQRLDTQHKEISARYQESRAKAVEGRHKTEMRHKIIKVVKKLNDLLLKETKDKHVPEELKKVVAEALDAVNMDTVGADERVAKYDALIAKATDPDVIEALTQTRDRIRNQGDRMKERIKKLKDAYEELKNAEGDIANAYDEDLAEYIDQLANEVGNTALRDMTMSQLEIVYEAYTAVLTTVQNANKAFKEAKGQSIREMGEEALRELRSLKQRDVEQSGEKLKAEEFLWNNEKPIYAFDRIGSKVLSMLYRNLQSGQDTYMTDQLDAKAFANEQKKKHGYDKWDFEKQYTFESSHGDSFQLSLSQIMSLYAYAKRNQARDHIRKGGIVFDSATELTKKGLLGVKKKVNVENSTAYNISDTVLTQICESLTQEQAAFVDEMQKYLSENMGTKGNEVSMALYGIRLFKEKNYFPLKSAPEYMEKAREQQAQKAEIKLKNSGMTKATVPNASNPVVLTPFMDVWADHVVDMSMYHSFVLPLEDFYRVYNFKTGQALDNSQTMSVVAAINKAHGKAASRYVDQFLKDLNGGVVTDPRESLGKALVSKFKKASVMASASVVVQQPTAVIRAMAMIDTRHFHGEKIGEKKMNALWEEAKKYAPVAAVKEMGYFDTHMGRSARDFLLAKEYYGLKQMVSGVIHDSDYRDELLAKPAAMADQIAWVWIWNAVKRETGGKHPNLYTKDRAEFFRIAGERFTDVINRTQVYDSVFSRSANMRSKSMWMNMVTSFMAEPTTTVNMLESAIRQWKSGDKRGAWKTASSVYGSVLLNALVVAAVYALRDDDEDEHFFEKYATAFTGKLLDGINPMTYFPFVRDIWSLMQGYDVERADMSLISDLFTAISRVTSLVSKDTHDMSPEKLEAHNKKLLDAILTLIDSGASLMGIPEKNIRRDIMAVANSWNMVIDGAEFDFAKLIQSVLEEAKNNIPVVNMLPD